MNLLQFPDKEDGAIGLLILMHIGVGKCNRCNSAYLHTSSLASNTANQPTKH